MKTHNIVQGSTEWLAYRREHFNASDAPAMMGCSPYTSRTELLCQIKTGLVPDVDPETQDRFDEGHRIEALARPLAEEIIGEALYPVVGSDGLLSASFDGLTMDEQIGFEHKTLNTELRECMEGEDEANRLPLMYRVQMEQQLAVSGAKKILFMASKWKADELIEERHCWYYPDLLLREAVVKGWHQFAIDLENFVPPVAEVKPMPAPQFGLPAVSIQVNGSIALIDNLQVFGEALTAYVDRINKEPQTDQDFADLEASVKTLKNAEDALDAAESGALAQTESIDTMRRTVAMYRDTARTNRLLIEKLVKSEKDARRSAIVIDADKALATHIKALNDRLGGMFIPLVFGDFPGVVKGLKSIDSMRDKVATELARCKIEANATADRIDANLKAIELASNYQFLFSDRATLALKEPEFVDMTIKNRVAEHQAAESKRLEAERARIAEEERVKAEAAAKIKADAEIAAAAEAGRQAAAAIEAAKAPEKVVQAAIEMHISNSTNVIELEPAAAPVVDVATPPTLKLGVICTRLGFQVTAEFLRGLGFEPAGRERAAVLYHEVDFPRICQKLIKHIDHVMQGVPA